MWFLLWMFSIALGFLVGTLALAYFFRWWGVGLGRQAFPDEKRQGFWHEPRGQRYP